MDAFRSVRGALLQVVHSLLLLPPLEQNDNGENSNSNGSNKSDENSDKSNDVSSDSVVAVSGSVSNSVGERRIAEIEKEDKVGENEDKWHIYVTGHSLGGALATLFSFELGRIRAGILFWISVFYILSYFYLYFYSHFNFISFLSLFFLLLFIFYSFFISICTLLLHYSRHVGCGWRRGHIRVNFEKPTKQSKQE